MSQIFFIVDRKILRPNQTHFVVGLQQNNFYLTESRAQIIFFVRLELHSDCKSFQKNHH